MIFTGKVAGLERGKKFMVLRFIDGRPKGYKAGYSRRQYVVTERGKDSVHAEETLIRMDEVEVPIFDGIDIGGETRISPRS